MHFDDVAGRLPMSLWRLFKTGLWAVRVAVIGQGAFAALRSADSLVELRDRKRHRKRATLAGFALFQPIATVS